MIKKFEVSEKVTEYLTLLLKVCMANPEVIDYKQSSLSPSCSATLNLLNFKLPDKFYNYTGRLLKRSEEVTWSNSKVPLHAYGGLYQWWYNVKALTQTQRGF